MNEVIYILINFLGKSCLFIFSDRVFFTTLQVILTLTFFYGLLHEATHKNSGIVVIRAKENTEIFLKFFNAIALIGVTQIIMSVNFINGYKTAFIVLDLIQVGYLCLLNSWFRNKLMGFYAKFQNKKENLG